MIKALANHDNSEMYDIKGPEYFFDGTVDEWREMDNYIDETSGNDSFLYDVAYYFDAKSHGYSEIAGIRKVDFKNNWK